MTNPIDRATKIIAEHLGVERTEITPDKTLEDLGADSLDHIEIVMLFEEEFGCEITDEDAEKVLTIQDAFDLLARLVPGAAS